MSTEIKNGNLLTNIIHNLFMFTLLLLVITSSASPSTLDKDKVWVLVSGNDIIWVVGYRIDERYKVTSKTNNLLNISLNE